MLLGKSGVAPSRGLAPLSFLMKQMQGSLPEDIGLADHLTHGASRFAKCRETSPFK